MSNTTCVPRQAWNISISFGEPLTTYPLPLLAEFFHEVAELGENELFHREADSVF
jgi:hypothetical protein